MNSFLPAGREKTAVNSAYLLCKVPKDSLFTPLLEAPVKDFRRIKSGIN